MSAAQVPVKDRPHLADLTNPPTAADVRKWREDHDLSQQQAASLLGVHERTVRAWEGGHAGRKPQPYLWHAMAHIGATLVAVKQHELERLALRYK